MATALPAPLMPRVSRAARVAGELEAWIQAEDRHPGERIATKEALRERFGVAVATINEAVRLLETRGVIEARPGPGGGIFVARVAVRVALMHTVLGFSADGTSLREVLVVRDALEPLICRAAARARRPPDVAALFAIISRMEAHGADPQEYFRGNWAFHRRLAQLTANAPLRSIYLTLLEYLEHMIETAYIDELDWRAHLEIHRELVAAIDDGPGARLEAAIAAHTPLPPGEGAE